MHIGSLRTALFAYLYAKKNNGHFIVRIEDTDRERFVPDAEERILESLKWAGITPDNATYFISPEEYSLDSHGPYVQSRRLDIYKTYTKQLIDSGHAYYAFDTSEELDAMRKKQEAEKKAPRYDRNAMRNQMTLEEEETTALIASGTPHTIRLKVPENEVVAFQDVIRGEVSFKTSEIDDQILMKSDGYPTYHLAVVVDDHLMEITHVIRGEEWLPSTPKHILLYQAFGWEAPFYAHLPLLVNEQKQKLSKREGDVSVEDFKDKGYLPEALVNFIALLGWNPGDEREFFNLGQLVQEFSLERVHKAPAVFDIKKLNSINSHYIRQIEVLDLVEMVKPFSKLTVSPDVMLKITLVLRDRLTHLAEFDALAQGFLTVQEYSSELLQFPKSTNEHTVLGLTKALEILQNSETGIWDDQEMLTETLGSVVHELGLKNGDVFWPVRVALSGQEKSASPVEFLWVLGKEESIKRIEKAVSYLK